MNRLKETKKIYDETKIPDELELRVRQTLQSNQPASKHHHAFTPWISLSLSIATAFIFLLNTSDVFAATFSDVPLVGQLAKIFTISSYQKEDSSKLVDVKIPALVETGNSELEERINNEIQQKIKQTVSESEENAKSYYQNFLEAGYDQSEFLPVIVQVDYEIKSSNENFVSFVITKLENYVSVDVDKYFYNIDLNTGEIMTLQDLYGTQYKELIDSQITQQIKEREESDKNQMFFHEYGLEFKTIKDNQNFYINSSNEVVVVFDKYEIAPGAMGFPEFTISSPTNLSSNK